MKIEFKFNSRSSGQNVPEAIRLAEKRGGYKEDKFYKVYFDSPEDMVHSSSGHHPAIEVSFKDVAEHIFWGIKVVIERGS